MKIYPQEIQDGISESVAKASVTFNAPLIKTNWAKAEVTDIFPLKSILVSTGWNKNTDVFDKAETWAARLTPINKKINYNHDERIILGHITNAYTVNFNNEIITEPVDNFHIITEGYIYTHWQTDERRDLVSTILSEMEDNEWFVSMECLFDDFDYALMSEEKSWVLKREEQTAFLTKHLLMYGGTGEYEGYKVGRLLRNMTFSGKGLVKNPANPNSIIFNFQSNEINFSEFSKSCVYKNKENIMADETKDLASALERIKELETQLVAKANEELAKVSKEADAKISALQTDVSTLETKLATASVENDVKEEKLTAAQQAIQLLEVQLAEAKKAKEEMEKEKEAMVKKSKAEKRTLLLVEAGLDAEEATEKSDRWSNVSDEVFDDFVAVMKVRHSGKSAAEVLETVEPEQTTVVPDEKDSTEALNAIAACFAEVFKSKGEK